MSASISPTVADTIAERDLSLSATLDATRDGGRAVESATTTRGTRGSTVLPRVEANDEGVRLVNDARERYAIERVLGEGGMGVVDLARDQDIERRVAIKRIRREAAGELGVARFAEEVRTIGRLEHPNIVPVHDVGIDEHGRYFLVMKYVEGETIEQVIEKLAAGDPETHRRYPFEARAQIFISLLRALAYAHDRGIIHRDLKPANVMVGPYGEVVLMDWGIARPIAGRDLPAPPDAPDTTADGGKRRLVETATTGLVGTPMYMSPEQAQGSRDLDERSDLYSACVVFQELLTLRHYLADRTTLPGVLTGVMSVEVPRPMSGDFWSAHPKQGPAPAEYGHFVHRGMAKDRAARWQSAHEMIEELERAHAGQIRVQCPVTFSKRMTREAGRFVDRHPTMTMVGLSLCAVSLVAAIGGAIYALAA